MLRARYDSIGVHYFCRETGLNILMDEIKPPIEKWSIAPRHVSIALSNHCNLACSHCYSPKFPARLNYSTVVNWATELDKLDCFGVGFGGGEPMLYPKFDLLCKELVQTTKLSISLTTHGHVFTPQWSKKLSGNIHFARVSMDGVGETYEKLRGRSFQEFEKKLAIIRDTTRFGVNFLLNALTIKDLDHAADFVFSKGAAELLLLPEVNAKGAITLDRPTLDQAQEWINDNYKKYRLTVSAQAARQLTVPSLPIHDPDRGDRELMHIDASGLLRLSAFSDYGLRIDEPGSVAQAITALRHWNTIRVREVLG